MTWIGCDTDGETRLEVEATDIERGQKIGAYPAGDTIQSKYLRIASSAEAARSRGWEDIARMFEP